MRGNIVPRPRSDINLSHYKSSPIVPYQVRREQDHFPCLCRQYFKLYFDIGTDNANVDAKTVKMVSVYRDYTFSKIGTGSINSEAFGDSWAVEWEKADDITWYRAIAPYEEGYNVVFKVGTDGKTVTVAKQAIMSDLMGYGTTYVAGSGELVDGVISVKLEFTASGVSFGQYKEVFYLPN